jgi:hypothetical protein
MRRFTRTGSVSDAVIQPGTRWPLGPWISESVGEMVTLGFVNPFGTSPPDSKAVAVASFARGVGNCTSIPQLDGIVWLVQSPCHRWVGYSFAAEECTLCIGSVAPCVGGVNFSPAKFSWVANHEAFIGLGRGSSESGQAREAMNLPLCSLRSCRRNESNPRL